MIQLGMAKHQLQSFQTVPLIEQPGCHRATTRMTTAALYASVDADLAAIEVELDALQEATPERKAPQQPKFVDAEEYRSLIGDLTMGC